MFTLFVFTKLSLEKLNMFFFYMHQFCWRFQIQDRSVFSAAKDDISNLEIILY